MNNVFDYLDWRDDILIDEINEVDALIFSRLSYMPFDNIINYSEKYTLKTLYDFLRSKKNIDFSNRLDNKLLEKLSNSKRYGNLIITNFTSNINIANEEQFAAVTIYLPNNSSFVSYRGTTTDIIGWKEDLNLTYMKEIPAQKDAVNYLNNIKPAKSIYIGGHSKGGNLAIYSASLANKQIIKKIRTIYSFDGPGFNQLNSNYEMIKNKITSYIPSDSVVGRLLYLNNKVKVVRSKAHGIKQHDLYTWCILKDKFIEDHISKESNLINNKINEWLNKITLENRKLFIDNTYKLIKATGKNKINEIQLNDLEKLILSYKDMDDETKKILFQVIRYLFSKKSN